MPLAFTQEDFLVANGFSLKYRIYNQSPANPWQTHSRSRLLRAIK